MVSAPRAAWLYRRGGAPGGPGCGPLAGAAEVTVADPRALLGLLGGLL